MRTMLGFVAVWVVVVQPVFAQQDAEPRDPAAGADAGPMAMPFVTVDVEAGHMDVEAVVVQRQGMLELAVTTVGGKEHEALFATRAQPQHVHLGLLMLGLKPGTTGSWEYENRVPKPIDPTGDRATITVIYDGPGGERVERGIGGFIFNRREEKALDESEFVFAGSRVVTGQDGGTFYLANGTGDLVSLVSFPERDEVLAYPKATSSENDAVIWEAHTEAMPELGTPVTLRIAPVRGDEGEQGGPRERVN